MMFRKIWNWILNPKLHAGACAALQVKPPCSICWICVGLFFTILAIISLLTDSFILAIALAITAAAFYTCGLIQNENEK